MTLDLPTLEEAGLIQETVVVEVPVKVEYRLTDDGQHLRPVIHALRGFGLWLREKGRP